MSFSFPNKQGLLLDGIPAGADPVWQPPFWVMDYDPKWEPQATKILFVGWMVWFKERKDVTFSQEIRDMLHEGTGIVRHRW